MSSTIEQVLMSLLQRDEAESYALPEHHVTELERALARACESENALDEVKRALALSVGLRGLGAVKAADAIEKSIEREPRALTLLAAHFGEAPKPRPDTPLRAPMIDAPKPAGARRLSDFIDTGNTRKRF